jgi:hypothetical protein
MKSSILSALVLTRPGRRSHAAAAQGGGDRPVIGVRGIHQRVRRGLVARRRGWELSGMLSNELSSSGLSAASSAASSRRCCEEQNLAASGRVASGTGAKIGKLDRARYLVYGTVSAFEENTKSTGGGISFGGVALGGKSSQGLSRDRPARGQRHHGEIDFSRTVEGTGQERRHGRWRVARRLRAARSPRKRTPRRARRSVPRWSRRASTSSASW